MIAALFLLSLPLAEVINLLDSTIPACDIRYTLTTEDLLASTYRDGRRIGSTQMRPEERPPATRSDSHYIFSGRREMLTSDGSGGRHVFLYDGTKEIILEHGRKEGVIRNRDLDVTHEGN